MKKNLLLLSLWLLPGPVFSQAVIEHSISIEIDGVEMRTTKPRKIKVGRVVYYTANNVKPDEMLRIWLGDFKKGTSDNSGKYIVINADKPPSKKEVKDKDWENKYQGFAAIRYVLETKEPRMTYHVGDSDNNDEVIQITNRDDGFLQIEFDDITLNGTHWKEKGIATVLGGVGRLKRKVESKAISSVTGMDWNIDPEGNGYKKDGNPDTIKLSNGVMRIKLKEEK